MLSLLSSAASGQLQGLPSTAIVRFEELELIRRIGEGSYGRVYLALWRETFVAAKVLLAGVVDATAGSQGGVHLPAGFGMKSNNANCGGFAMQSAHVWLMVKSADWAQALTLDNVTLARLKEVWEG
jgi:serine/threonine protein kinase